MILMWKDIALYGASSIFTYFHTERMCGNTRDIFSMTILSFIINSITLAVVLLKKPIKVVDNRVDLK